MRFLLVLLAAFVFSPAIADPAPACYPKIPGTTAYGDQVHFYPVDDFDRFMRSTSGYAMGVWWCRGKYANSVAIYSMDRSAFPSFGEVLGVALAYPTMTKAQVDALHVKYATKRLTPERRALGWTLLEKDRPALPKWIVAKNGLLEDRPVYSAYNGVRGTVQLKNVRAAKGGLCACDRLVIEEGSSSYCALQGDPIDLEKVTLCVKG